MWLIESWGVEGCRKELARLMGLEELPRAVHNAHTDLWPRRDILGVHKQKQAGLNWVGACIPAGRMHVSTGAAARCCVASFADAACRAILYPLLLPNTGSAA